MKRLLVFAGYFYPHMGGSELAIYELCRRLVNKGYEIDIVTCNTEKAPIIEKLEGFSVYRLPSWNILNNMYPLPKPTLTTLKILLKLLKKRHDLINTHTRFFITSFVGLIFAKVKRVPLLHKEHGAGHNAQLSKPIDLISRAYDHTLGALILKLAYTYGAYQWTSYRKFRYDLYMWLCFVGSLFLSISTLIKAILKSDRELRRVMVAHLKGFFHGFRRV